MTHRVGPTLPRPLSTAKIIKAVAALLPLSAKRPAHPEILASQGPSAKPTPQSQEQVRSSETESTPRAARPERPGTGESIRIKYAIRFRMIGKSNPSTCHQGFAATLGKSCIAGVLGFQSSRRGRLQVCYSHVVTEESPDRDFQSPIP